MGWREKTIAKLDKMTSDLLVSEKREERLEGGKRVKNVFRDIIRETARMEGSFLKQKALAGIYETQLAEGVDVVNRLAIHLASARGLDPINRFLEEGALGQAGVWGQKIQKFLQLHPRATFGDVNWTLVNGPKMRPSWRRWVQVIGERLVRFGYGKERTK